MPIKTVNHKVCIAPMMDHTDKHFRYFMRLLSKHMMLYTEMITTGAILYGDKNSLLNFNSVEHPVAIQLGGNNPDELASSAQIAEDYGYDEINLNIGCPSDRVQNGQFGASMMAKPELVGECVNRIQSKVTIPVSVKTRIGIDDSDSYDFFKHFITTVTNAGCKIFIIHARKAILKGLSPKQNREIPPLKYDRVYKLKNEFPKLEIIINGGITNPDEIEKHSKLVDGVMLGRVAYQNPYLLSGIDQQFYNSATAKPDRKNILNLYIEYIQNQVKLGAHSKNLTRHIIGLYQGQPGARRYRQILSDSKPSSREDMSYLNELIDLVSDINHKDCIAV